MTENSKNIPNPRDFSAEIRHVPRMLGDGELSLRIAASTYLEGGQPAGTPRPPYIPHDVPEGYPPLDFKPIALRTWFLVITLIFFVGCLGSIIGILVCNHASQTTLHLHGQQGFLAFRYLPSIIGTITTIWWRSIGAALFHVMPYISMADRHRPSPRVAKEDEVHVLSRHHHLPTPYSTFSSLVSELRSLVSEKNWLMLSVFLLQLMFALFLVPTKAVFVQLLPNDGGWIVSVSRIAAGFLIVMYSLLITCTIYMVLWFQDRQTGLKWDPACIADQIALIQGSNILESFHGLEFATMRQARDALARNEISRGIPQLGYWKIGDSGEIWHGIAFPDAPETLEPKTAVASESMVTGVLPVPPFDDHQNAATVTRQSNGYLNDDSGKGLYSSSECPLDWKRMPIQDPENSRFRAIKLFHTYTFITFYVLLGSLAIGLLTLPISKGITHWRYHFRPSALIPSSLSPPQLKPLLEPVLKNFVFQFCPAFMMVLFTNLWIVTDNFYRNVQPIAGMYRATPAHKSILLDYMQCPSIIAIPKAALNRHWRVTWFSLLALTANAGPIVATGIFISSPVEGGFLVKAAPLNLWFILSLLIIYLITLPFVRPRPKHRLPRQIVTIADMISYCYASRLVNDEMFCVQKPDDEKIHLESKVHLGKKSYEFGLYKGTDGRRHIGMDIVDPKYPIDAFDPGRSIHVLGCRMWFRRPTVLKRNVA